MFVLFISSLTLDMCESVKESLWRKDVVEVTSSKELGKPRFVTVPGTHRSDRRHSTSENYFHIYWSIRNHYKLHTHTFPFGRS